jgi:AP2 domain
MNSEDIGINLSEEEECTVELCGIPVLISRCDLNRVQQKHWTVYFVKGIPHFQTRIATANGAKRSTLARYILDLKDGEVVTRVDGTSALDHRRCSISGGNMAERQSKLGKRGKNRTSSFKGVSYCSRDGLWKASIRPAGRSLSLGGFHSELEAAAAYDRAARFYFGPDAYQNLQDDELPTQPKLLASGF